MRTLIDLGDEATPCHDPLLPDPSSISMDGDEVVVMLRELELRMTFGQFFELTEAFNSWIFEGLRGEKDLVDPDSCAAEEHQRLREIVGEIVNDGKVGEHEVSDALRQAVRLSVSSRKIDMKKWHSQGEVIRSLKDETELLRAELDARKARKARRT
jgi:hypothetical protein